ncbi:hypothetical protein [Hyphomicrobium sp.]|uniref:hypothetical protein n=1 Tax=Hyphomicrobium sp. TaxID=82 RepID=UPI002FE16959
MIPLLLDRGQSVRANISLDAGLLEAFDTEASRCSLTRSAFFVSAAMGKVVGVETGDPKARARQHRPRPRRPDRLR